MARLGALLCAQYHLTSAHIRVCWPLACVYPGTKAVRRGKLIGAVGNDEFTTALGDMGQKQQKSALPIRSYS